MTGHLSRYGVLTGIDHGTTTWLPSTTYLYRRESRELTLLRLRTQDVIVGLKGSL